jgi:hypothetical protein
LAYLRPRPEVRAHRLGVVPGNYATLPPPLLMRAGVVGMIGDWLVQRLRRCLAHW